jgi:hypothetical protein
MRQIGNESYSVVVAPSVWTKVESVPPATMTRLEEELGKRARALSEREDGRGQRLEALNLDGYIVVYEVCPARRSIILSSILCTGGY